MSPAAEIRFKYVLDGDGLAAVNRLTGEVLKLAAAEDAAAGRARALGREVAAVKGGGRDNPLLDEAFGLTPRQRADAASGRAEPPGRGPAAPRPGGPDDDRGRGGGLVRALDALTAAVARQTAALESLRGPPGTPAGAGRADTPAGRGGRGLAAGRPPGGADADGGDADREDAARRRQEEAARASRMRAGVAFAAVAAAGVGGDLARQQAVPFMDDQDRFWATARKFQIPGVNVGVSDLRDIQLWLQRMGSGKDREEERRKVIGLEAYNAQVRQPFEEFRRQFETRRAGVEHGVRDAYGEVLALPPVPPPPVRPPAVDPRDYELDEDDLKTPPEEQARRKRNRAAALRAETERTMAAEREFERLTAERTVAVRRREEARQQATRFAPFLPLPDLPDARRGTLGERQEYERGAALLPARDRQVTAQRDLRVVEAQIREKEEQSRRAERELAASEAEAAKQERLVAAAGDPYAREEAVVRRSAATKAASLYERQKRQLDADLLDLRLQQGPIRGGVREADAGYTRAELGLMRGREETARGQAAALAYAGPAGRAQADYALSVIREAGVANTPAEILAMARPLYGKTLDALAEREGQQFVPQARAQAPDEYRDTLPEARAQVDALAQQVRRFEQTNPGEVLKEALDAIRGLGDVYERLQRELERFKREAEAESRQKNSGQ